MASRRLVQHAGILGIVMDFGGVEDGGKRSGARARAGQARARQLASRVGSSRDGKLQRCSRRRERESHQCYSRGPARHGACAIVGAASIRTACARSMAAPPEG